MFLQTKGVHKNYKTGAVVFKALNNASFAMAQGEVGIILGPSGSGKSTLLNIIGGIDRADEGQVIVDGQDISALDDSALTLYRRESAGFIFQFYNLIPNLTVGENVEVAANICKDPWDIETILDAVHMKDSISRFPRELSGGQQQRVSIARALVKRPKLLLCDEPTGALDYETAKEVLSLLVRINKDYSTTIMIITHNAALCDMAHRILRLRSGEIIEDRVNENLVPPERIEW